MSEPSSARGRRLVSAVTLTWIGMVAVSAVLAALAWHHRWISDDGLIYVRTIRQILAGNGPVFNAFERVESNTSTLWPWLIAAISWITGGDPARVAVALGGVLSIAGVALAMDGTRRFHRARGSTAVLVPGGVLVVLGVYPFWDFATSGLETGLCTLWLAAIWWCLNGLRGDSSTRRQFAIAVVLGLGPLVRPDFAIPAGVFSIAAWWIVRPGRRRTIALVVAAGVLPVAYEVFRAGYYGTLVPLPAFAKSATGSEWVRGLLYVVDFMYPYWLWLPIAILAGLLAAVLRRGGLIGRDRIVVAAPVVSAVVLIAFVIKVGGDFMHARMLLAPAFLLLLPSLLLPWRRLTAPAILALAGWAVVIGVWRDDNRTHTIRPQIDDERAGYLRYTGHRHPIDGAAYVEAAKVVADMVFGAIRSGRPEIVFEGGWHVPMAASVRGPVVFVVGRLGMGGAVTPIDGIVGDTLGLANPIGARITRTSHDTAGHEKQLPWSWLLADFGDRATDYGSLLPGVTAPAIAAARHAMTCGRLAELLRSVREPMSQGQFWDNLTGAIGRTGLGIPADPFVAERTFCDRPLDADLALGATVAVSSSYESSGWTAGSIADGVRTSTDANPGFCSELGRTLPHEEWIAVTLPRPETFSRVVIHPSKDLGFPIDFAIQTWKDGAWVDQVKRVDYARPAMMPQAFALPAPVIGDRVRLDATRLRDHPGLGYVLQVAEIELLP